MSPRQGGELAAQAGLAILNDQQVAGVLDGGQPVGVVALGVHGVGVMMRLARFKPSSSGRNWAISFGGGVHVGLGQDTAAGVVHRRQQVHLRVAVVAAATQGLAVDRDRPPQAGH
jgi:hypothetical protein